MADFDDDEEQLDENQAGINTGRWTREEHNKFIDGLELYGKEWKKIADMIETRSVVQIRTHAQKYFQKIAKTTGQPVMSTSKKDDIVRHSYKRRKNSMDGSGDFSAPEGIPMEPTASTRHSSRKPNAIQVPKEEEKIQYNTERKSADDEGGATPRTVAAATILLRPRIQHKLEQTGGDTPTTRQKASWLATHQERAAQILGTRGARSALPTSPNTKTSSGASMNWSHVAIDA